MDMRLSAAALLYSRDSRQDAQETRNRYLAEAFEGLRQEDLPQEHRARLRDAVFILTTLWNK